MTVGGRSARGAAAEELQALVPQLKRRYGSQFPADLRAELEGVTSHQLEAICQLSRSGATTMNDLARQQNCAFSTATALADRLLRAGLAERVPDAEDRRVVRLVPTEHARQLATRFQKVKREIALRALSVLDDNEVATLLTLLRKVITATEDDE